MSIWELHVALVSMQLYISIYKKTIVHNDFNNFCNTMNKVWMQIVLERDYAAIGIICILIDMSIGY